MRLDAIIVADAATATGGKVSILGAWNTRLKPPHFPWREPLLALIVRGFVDEADYGQPHLVEVAVETPDGQTVMPAAFTVSVEDLAAARAELLEGESHGVICTNLLVGMTFAQPGLYQVVARFDGVDVGRYALPVALQEAEQANP